MAGHPGKITFTNEVIVKKATNDEIWAYSNLIPLGLSKFTPNLISYTETSIEIENLMSGTDPNHVRIVDIKLGTSTCTKNAKSKPGKIEYRAAKDMRTTSFALGFCICGYKTPAESRFKTHTQITAEDVQTHLKKVIYGDLTISSVRKWLTEFLEFLKTENKAEIRGASILIVTDETRQVCRIKLIDLGSIEITGQTDEGLVKGVESLL